MKGLGLSEKISLVLLIWHALNKLLGSATVSCSSVFGGPIHEGDDSPTHALLPEVSAPAEFLREWSG